MSQQVSSVDEIEAGEILKTNQGQFLKVMSVEPNNHRVKGIDAFKDDDDSINSSDLDIVKVTADEINIVLNKREFGQVKRFRAKGSGFSRLGRKLKYNRSRYIDEVCSKVEETIKSL